MRQAWCRPGRPCSNRPARGWLKGFGASAWAAAGPAANTPAAMRVNSRVLPVIGILPRLRPLRLDAEMPAGDEARAPALTPGLGEMQAAAHAGHSTQARKLSRARARLT